MVNNDATFPNQNDRSRSTDRTRCQSVVIMALMVLVISSFIHDRAMLEITKQQTTTTTTTVIKTPPTVKDGDAGGTPPRPRRPPPHSSSNTIMYDSTNKKNMYRIGGLLRHELPLTYPFHIIQFGVPRTGSTFQYELLKAIIYLKSPPYEQQIYKENTSMQNYNEKVRHQTKNKYDKTHRLERMIQFLNQYKATTSSSSSSTSSIFTSSPDIHNQYIKKVNISTISNTTNIVISVFNQYIKKVNITTISKTTNSTVTAFNEYVIDLTPSSSSKPAEAVAAAAATTTTTTTTTTNNVSSFYHVLQYNQQISHLYNCSLCEIDNYIPIFNLSQVEVTLLKEYMSYYQDLRQCCGMQMSKYNFYRLHNCSMSTFQQLPQYPWCEIKNLTDIELKMTNHIIPHRAKDLNLVWTKQGDCLKYDTKIIENNLDFNYRKFPGCPTS